MNDIQRAIEDLKEMLQYPRFKEVHGEFYETSISAMEELQQYRELCKPEEIEHMKSLVRIIRCHGTIGKALEVCAEYEAIGTTEECREAVEKQIPMKVTDVHIDEYYCPACGAENNCDQGKIGDKYCPECGQAIVQEGEERC